MLLTIEDDRETIKRYGHIRPALGWKVRRCSVRCPGNARPCTRHEGHRGPHVAHGRLWKVLAVWDGRAEGRKSGTKVGGTRVGRSTGKRPRRSIRRRSLLGTLKGLSSSIVGSGRSLESFIFLIMFLAFLGFAIHWLLLMAGGG